MYLYLHLHLYLYPNVYLCACLCSSLYLCLDTRGYLFFRVCICTRTGRTISIRFVRYDISNTACCCIGEVYIVYDTDDSVPGSDAGLQNKQTCTK